MFRQKSLSVVAVLFTFFVMLLSGLLTTASIVVLRIAGLLPSFIYATLWMPFFTIFASILIGSAISAYLCKRLLRPIQDLIEATRKVAKGDFTVKLDDTQGDGEIGELLSSFNVMTSELSGIEMFRSDFINSFSHEFKTPIVSIRGFAKQLQRDELTSQQRKEYTDIIVSESERLSRLSSNVLLLTKLENQQIVTDVSDFSLDEQLRTSILLFEKQWSAKNIELDLDLQPVNYRSNAEMVSEIWVNLLSNAVKFTGEGGKISVSCGELENCVIVSIRDNGVGMTQETRERIFSKFYQGDTSHAQEGNGLGLALVSRIVELCRGKIDVKSAPGEGSEFLVYLPKQAQCETEK